MTATVIHMRSLGGGYGKPPNQIDWDKIIGLAVLALLTAYLFATGGGQ